MKSEERPVIRKRLKVRGKTRDEIRTDVLCAWVMEQPGEGRDDLMQRYRYDVEKLSDGSWVYLIRPAGLNKGCDFKVFCEGWGRYKNGNDRPPSHKTLLRGIRAVIRRHPRGRAGLLRSIRLVWECKSPNSCLRHFGRRHPCRLSVERILGVAKWLFIEQDITYWATSGRAMLRGFLEGKLGQFP